MRKKLSIMVSIMLIMVFVATTCLADNPVVQTIYTADPFPMVYDGVCYLYTDHDEDTIVNNFYTMNDWKCYSSTDMVNWTDRGTMLSYKTFSWAQGDAWAGQVIYRNGKFYMYVPMTRANAGGARVIGVAVSNSPTGPFTDALGKPLITNNGASDIDPTVFIDDNGQAYLYWGNGNLYYVKLNQDMISYSGGVVTASPKPNSYVEGPWFYKRGNLYYMVYAGMGSGSENIQYATSTSPTGPWTSKGVLMGSQNSYTNHPAVCDYGGNSYFFYHTGGLSGGGSYHRSVCIEKFTYNSDGTIPTIPMTTAGVSGIVNLNPYVTTEAETICWESGVETEKCSEGGMDVCNIENGDYIKVEGVDFGSGATSFDARVASAGSGGNIELRLDSATGTLVGTCAVSGTGGWQTWVNKSCTVSGATGKHDLYLKFTGGSGSLLNFNWWKFNTSSTPTPTPTPTTGATVTPTPTGATATPTPTPTGTTATPTPTPTPVSTSGGIKIQFFNGSTAATINTISPNFKVINTGTLSINLSDVKVRYYFTNDGTQANSFACDYSTAGAGNVTGTFTTIAKTNADRYLEVGFTSAAGTLSAGASAEVKGRLWKSDWSNFTQTNDYSFNSTATNYVDPTTVTGYLAGTLNWGIEP